MAEPILKVVKTGKSIDSTDPRDFSLHSEINTLKIYKSGYGTLSLATGVTSTVNITHNLGYKPIIFGFFKHPGSSCWFGMPCRTYNTFGIVSPRTTWDLIGSIKNADVNTVQLNFYDGYPAMPSSPVTVEYKYYILADPRENAWYEAATSDTDDAGEENFYGIKISRPGINSTTAEYKNLVLSSGMKTFKEYAIIEYTGTDYTEEETISHGLDYPPTFLVLGDVETGVFGRGDVIGNYRGGWGNVCVDSSNVYINTIGVAYIILLIDPLNE